MTPKIAPNLATKQTAEGISKMAMRISIVSSLALLLFAPRLGKAQTCDDTSSQQSIIDWVRSNGGHFSTKQEFRRATDDSSSYFGIFATQDIEKGELLTSVPWKCVITAQDDENVDDARWWLGAEDHAGYFFCDSTRLLVEEMKKGAESFYYPYTKYLIGQPRGKIPSDWSDAGKDLLEEVLGYDMLPPEDAVGLIELWKQTCLVKGESDPLEEKAFIEYHARSDDNVLIPLYDLHNHAQGNKANILIKVSYGQSQDAIADRPIKKGEQLCFSYNLSPHVPHSYYGTSDFLRDYGFVEPFPQQWGFLDKEIRFTLQEDENGKTRVTWRSTPSPGHGRFLREQLGRLRDVVQPHLKQIEKEAINPAKSATRENWSIPTLNELATIRQYFDALKLAISAALEALPVNGDGDFDDEDAISYYYHMPFVEKGIRTPDEHETFPTYNWETENPEWEGIEIDKSGFQEIEWVGVPGKNDLCFLLDGEHQSCSAFRAHYHDIAAHFPTRYLETVRRVAILGGGDSLLLHEMMKYDSIELIVQLELDQRVVRTSHKYFASQPFFHDERVQWWFGDAAKSLLMLPSEYFGSFDLVFVDFSESGFLSESVTSDLTVWEVIAQLVAPEGLLVKNELYHETLMPLFDHTMLIYFENVPFIQSWALSIGSNQKELLHLNTTTMTKWNSIKTVYEGFTASPKNFDDHLKFVHDYQKNDARAQGKCSSKSSASASEEPLTGILFILEAENASRLGDLEWPTLEGGTLFAALQYAGATPLSTVSHSLEDERALGAIFMREGIVVTRTWPEKKYCAFDIQLWGAFDKIDTIKASIAKAVGSGPESLSSYRIITSGIQGTVTESEDRKRIGPKNSNFRECDLPKLKEVAIDKGTVDAVIEESLGMIQEESGVAAILCGSHDKPCQSYDAFSKKKGSLVTVPLRSCPSVENIEPESESFTQEMFACEMELLNQLRRAVSQGGKLVAFVFDSSASVSMAMLLASRIWRNPRNRQALLAKRFTFIASKQDESDGVTRHFLEWLRTEMVDYGKLFRAEVAVESSNERLEMGFLSGQDTHFVGRLVNVTRAIETRTGIDTEIQKIEGGVERVDPEQDTTSYLEDDYERRAGEAQFFGQRPLAEQHVIQFETKKGNLSPDLLKEATLAALVEQKDAKFHVLDEVGFIMGSVSSLGTVVVVADGVTHVDINVFAYESDLIESVVSKFEQFLEEKIPLERLAYDKMPRGVGRVVNLWKDLNDS